MTGKGPGIAIASGAFEVKMSPQAAAGSEPASVGRIVLDKRYLGQLDAQGAGQMLAMRGSREDSAGYVAIEQVEGALHGRRGGFALQHSGTMTRGAPQLSITVVPDSGSGGLTGIAGTMTIEVRDGKHYYTLTYSLEG